MAVTIRIRMGKSGGVVEATVNDKNEWVVSGSFPRMTESLPGILKNLGGIRPLDGGLGYYTTPARKHALWALPEIQAMFTSAEIITGPDSEKEHVLY